MARSKREKIPFDYITLEELCRYNNSGLRYGNYFCSAFRAIRQNPEIFKIVSETLKILGMRRFQYIANGDRAMILKSIDNQIIRISYAERSNPRLYHPCVLQPIKHYDFNQFPRPLRIEVMPRMQSDKNNQRPKPITLEDEERLYEALEESNLCAPDLNLRNAAYLKDGTPIIIDADVVEPIGFRKFNRATLPILLDGDHLEDWHTEITTDSGKKRVWKQHACFPAIQTGVLSGVITGNEIGNLEKNL